MCKSVQSVVPKKSLSSVWMRTDEITMVNIILHGKENGINVVVNGADGITFGGGGNGSVSVSRK